MDSVEKTVAKDLLDINAVELSPDKPFTWASGWKAPIYCDNRKMLSYPKIRSQLALFLADCIKKHFPDTNYIAGVATGAIAMGVLVADRLGLPFVYVRPKPKDHGLCAQIEGVLPPSSKVTVIEDLISTGSSSLSAVDILRKNGVEVMGMAAIFSYNFSKARRAFEYANIELLTLSNYEALVDEALTRGYIKKKDEEILKDWRFKPDTWGQE
ncbi:MAG: orotate phosphoribosyltransferase [Bacteroidales bacterium]|jgi:orotate phosphoribosyltransferase|nr:orotate phosphoribosyltransferase [Bacteroidales bacterium]MCI2121475.1 orotate phosphoribosyltransferase [Bacteroidales bacterium]MCI2145272.1 orotate phosphoribosyltransferase [Bacteroidales bacterium]